MPNPITVRVVLTAKQIKMIFVYRLYFGEHTSTEVRHPTYASETFSDNVVSVTAPICNELKESNFKTK